MKHIYAFVLSIILLVPNPLFAEGSKDLYPSGAMGARAFLVSHNPTAPVTGWPYLTEGTHYVYGRLGETITAASSAQGSGNGQLVLIAPDGMIYSSELGSTVGQIANRSEELAGPYAVGGYTPFSHMVGPGQEGIWEIRFISTRSTNSFWPKGVSGGANSNWTGHNDNSNAIRAWDVTVFDSAMNPISGRVYANLLNQYTSAGYYGILFVLTNDGYVYKVSANGHSGIGFMSFVNNKGLTLGTGDNAPPSYKSADSFSTDIPTKDPREPDGAKTFTHKMFYSFPDVNMPASANMPARTTWLNPPKIVPTVTNITIMGNEGTEDRIGTKGGAFDFETNMAGTYKISITTGGGFVQRNLTGFAELGANSVFWDGRDGAGNPMVPGTADITVNVQLQGAEVHFPLVDVEHNANGMIIEQLNDDGSVKSDIVYWDDSEIVSTSTHPSNPLVNGNDGLGISSNLNGHKWSSHFGDTKIMDTWAYVLGDATQITKSIEIVEVDLAITGVTSDPPLVRIAPGETVTYAVPVINYGPGSAEDAPFAFKVPPGFTIANIADVSYSTTCGEALVSDLALDASGHVTALLDLPSGCGIEFSITGTVGDALICQSIAVEASIMRPADVTDLDATNPDPLVPPTDPHVECLNGTAMESCNNIKYNDTIAVGLPSPISLGDLTGCQGNTLTAAVTVAPGHTVSWYDAPIGGNLVSSPEWSTVGSISYFAEAFNASCTSSQRTEITLRIDPTPTLVITDPEPICEPGSVDLTVPGVTLGSDSTLDLTFFTDLATTLPLADPTNVASSGTYYIKATDPTTFCSITSPVEVVIIGQPELLVGQPTCGGGTGSITVLEPLGPIYEYSIDGTNYQNSPDFVSVLPGNYDVTARNNVTNCVSPVTATIIDASPSNPVPVVVQPDCSTATGSISLPHYTDATYSTDGGLTFVTSNVFPGLAPGSYSVVIKDQNDCNSSVVAVIIDPQPTSPAAPVVGADLEGCFGDTLWATATPVPGTTIVWYDAPLGGNPVPDPQWSGLGTVTYYAQADNGSCGSATRTPLNLTIQALPIGNAGPDQFQNDSGDFVLDASSMVGTGEWTVADGTPAITISDPYDPQATIGLDPFTTVTLRWTLSNAGCTLYDEVVLGFMPEADIVTEKSTSIPSQLEFTPGDLVAYQITVTNNGPADATNVHIQDTAPMGTTIIGWTATVLNGTVSLPGTTGSGNLAQTLALLPNGASILYTVEVQTPSDFIGTLVNVATVSSSIPDPDTSCTACAAPPLTAVPKADLVTVKTTADPAQTEFTPGDIVSYQITVTNNGPNDAENVRISDLTPRDTEIVQWTAQILSGMVSLPNTTGEWELDESLALLPNGASVRYTLELKTASDFSGTLVNVASVSSPTFDPDPSCMACTAPPLTSVPKADLVTVKTTADPAQSEFTPGDIVSYQITLTNNGPSDATNVHIEDFAPTGTTISGWTATVLSGTVSLPVSSGSGNLDQTLGLLPNGASVLYTVEVQTASNFSGTLVNTALVSSPTLDPDPTCTACTTPPLTNVPNIPQADLVTEKTAIDPTQTGFIPGGWVEYSIRVANQGPHDAENVQVTDIAPIGTTIAQWSATVVAGTVNLPATSGNGNLDQTLALLPNGAIVEFRVLVQTPTEMTADLVNTVTVVSTTQDPDPDCPGCSITLILERPSIALIKTAVFNDENRNGNADVGETISYVFTITNTGDVPLENIRVEDGLPGLVLNGNPISLLPGESDNSSYSAVYAIGQQDIANGGISNQAMVHGQALKGGLSVADSSDDTDNSGDNPTVTALDGCTLQVHNAISPNGDGLNDFFHIRGIECYPDNTVQIFNRWGVLVFDISGYDNASKAFQGFSDGRTTISRAEALPSGTYYYLIHLPSPDGGSSTKSGFLNLNR